MLEFTLKFLSGESRKYIVDDSATVRQFKERLSHELNIPIERQRIIFQGKVLQDDTKLADSNIHEKTLHFVERAEPIPPAASTANTSNTSAPNVSASGHASGGINQTLLDDVNETTSIFINGLPGSAVLQPNDIQTLVRNLLSDLGDVGRQAQVNTTMASDGHGVDVNIDFGNINQILEQQEIHERFRSIGRMLARLRHRIDHIQVKREFNRDPMEMITHVYLLLLFLANRRFKFSANINTTSTGSAIIFINNHNYNNKFWCNKYIYF